MLTPRSVFRRYETDGVPSSGPHDPDKDEIVDLLDSLIGSANGAAVVRPTEARLQAVTPVSEYVGGMVLSDPSPARNGYYYRSGGAWVWGRGLSDAFAELLVTGGDANEVRASVGVGVSPSTATVLFLTPNKNNTGPATLSINNGPALPIFDVNGQPLTPGKMTIGRVVLLAQGVGNFRMLSDPSGDGIVDAASAFAESAAADREASETARNEAEYFAEQAALGNKGEDGDGFFRGFTYSMNSADPANDIDIAPGAARDLLNQSTISLETALTKRVDALWTPGSGQGGLDVGVVANATWYYIHAIHNPTSGVTDVLFSTSQSAPVMPTGFTRRRWIGAFTYVLGGIFPFVNNGEWVQFKTPAGSVSAAVITTTPELFTLASPPGVKSEVDVYAIAFEANETPGNMSQNAVCLRDPDLGPFVGSLALASMFYAKGQIYGGKIRLFTDNLGRVYAAAGLPAGAGGAVNFTIFVQAVRFDRQTYR